MISTVKELDQGLGLLERAHAELLEEGYKLTRPSIGVMIEVPSADTPKGPIFQNLFFK